MLGPIRVKSIIAVILLISAAYFLWREASRLSHVDFKVYMAGAEAVLDDVNLYSAVDVNGLVFTYPPFAAAVFIPLTLFPSAVAFGIWTAISLACLFGIGWLIAARLPAISGYVSKTLTWEVAAYICAISAFSETIVKNIELGQVNIALVLLIMYDTVSRTHYRGFLTGLAAGFKVAPAIFIVFMLVNRRWGDFGRAMLGFATTLVIGSFFGIGQVWQYWTAELFDTSRVGHLDRLTNVSALGMFTRWTSEFNAKILWLAASAIVFVLAFAVAAKWWNHSRLAAATVIGLAALFITPISWVHHFVWMIPACCVAIALAIRAFRTGSRWVGALLTFTATVIAVSELGYLRYNGEKLANNSDFLINVVGSGYAVICVLSIITFGVALKLVNPAKTGDLEPEDQESTPSSLADTSSTDPMPST